MKKNSEQKHTQQLIRVWCRPTVYKQLVNNNLNRNNNHFFFYYKTQFNKGKT